MEMRGNGGSSALGFVLNQCMPYSPNISKPRTVPGDEIVVYRVTDHQNQGILLGLSQ